MRSTVEFLLFDWLRVESMFARERFADHSAESVRSVLEMCGWTRDELVKLLDEVSFEGGTPAEKLH